MARIGVSTRLVVAVALAVGAAATTASAHHIAGATYTGTHAGGGTVSFDVSPDGTKITRFEARGIKGDVCEGDDGVQWNPGFGDPLVDHAFTSVPGSSPSLSYRGSFPRKQAAEGSFSVDVTQPEFGRCRAENVSWTATTTAPLTGSEECRNALAAVTAAQGQADAAQTAANAATAAVKSARNRIKKARTKLGKATTPGAKKKAQKQLKLANKALATARANVASAVTQQQDAATQQQVAAAQQQAEC
jgi:hypothetical protein